MARSPSLPRRTTLATVVAALLLALVPVGATASTTDDSSESTQETGTVNGTIFTRLDSVDTAPDGRAVFVDADSGELAAEAVADDSGDFGVQLPAGTYAVIFYNSSNGQDLEGFFPELYARKALFSLDPTLVELAAGETVTITGLLSPLFLDIPDSIYADEIIFLRNLGVTRGCNPPDNTRYCPGEDVSRGAMAAFLGRFLGLEEIARDADFRDIEDSVFEADIRRLATAGITRGCNPTAGNTRYCPQDSVSRGEMAAFIVRAIGLTEIDPDIDFQDIDGSVFHDDIRRLATAGITFGCNPDNGNTRYCPEQDVTRGQMAAFLTRTAVVIFGRLLTLGDQQSQAGFDRTAAAAYRQRRPDLQDR